MFLRIYSRFIYLKSLENKIHDKIKHCFFNFALWPLPTLLLRNNHHVTEKVPVHILNNPKEAELVSKCRYARKYLLQRVIRDDYYEITKLDKSILKQMFQSSY